MFHCLMSKKDIYYWYFTEAPVIRIVELVLPLLTGKFLYCSLQFDLSQDPFFRPLSHLVVLLCSGRSEPLVYRLPKTDQSDENEVAHEGGPSVRTTHPLNLFHSALLSFTKMIQKILPPKAHAFLNFVFCLSFPQALLIWRSPRMKNCP